MGFESLQVKLSGGATNTDPALSTGGVKSSTAVLSQLATIASAIPGITAYDAAGNVVGTGTLAYQYSGKTATWAAPGDTVAGTAVSIGANGRYLIQGANPTSGYILIDVVSASLSSALDYSSAVTIAGRSTLFLPAVSKDDAYTGATQYFLYYLDNTGAASIKTLTAMLETDTPGVDTLSLSAIATKNTTELQAAAAGHTYSGLGVPITLGDLSTTDYWGVWVKRVIPALTVDGVTANTFKLRFTTLT